MSMSAALMCASLAHLALSAQSGSPTPQATFRGGVDVVRLDVSVLDKGRHPIRGLTSGDFTVLEDGKPQPIVAFSAVDVPDTVEPSAPWMRDVGPDVATNQLDTRRILIIVMDDGMTETDPGITKRAKQIAHSVIDRLGPSDLAAVVFTFHGRAQNFTTDHRQLLAAAETFVPKTSVSPGPMSAAAGPREVVRVGPFGFLGCALQGRHGCLTDTLKRVASALQDSAPGRKTIVLISTGVPYDFSMSNLEAGEEMTDLRETFQNLQRASINVYPFDPAGLTPESIVSARLESLRVFAESTGGRAVLATNAPWERVDQVFLENSSYYLIGIHSTNAARDGGFRRIAVKVNRPDVDVRTRSGYFAEGAKKAKSSKSPVQPATELQKALAAGLPTGELPLEISVAPFAVPGRKQAALAIVVSSRVDASQTSGGDKMAVLTMALDKDFKQRSSHRQTISLVPQPNAAGVRRFELYSRLTVPPGRYEVRVAGEGFGAAGGVFTGVDVPDFWKSGIALSGLILGSAPSGNGGSFAVLSDVIPIAPTIRREFAEGEPVTAFLRVYQGGKEPLMAVRLTARILDTASRAVFEDMSTVSADSFSADRAADYRLDLSRARLGPGQYLLTVEAARGRTTAARDVRFSVQQR